MTVGEIVARVLTVVGVIGFVLILMVIVGIGLSCLYWPKGD